MPLVDPRILATFRSRGDRCRDAPGMRSLPERIVLDVKEGVRPSDKPPVRIFLGTEPAQYRAERIFVWSIEQVRDPARIYEIHLMKELSGFDRRRWLTGFTNYRYAIPHFAGGAGRAIWNDVDEIYLGDPAELFDTDMSGCGFLTIPRLSPTARVDSSVMLMDCEKMAAVWSLEAAQNQGSKSLLDRAVSVPGLHGDLVPEWNARDEEYEPDRSKLIHYTVLHTQPWQPLPGLFVYQRNPVGRVWYDLERAADAAGYCVFSAERPSRRFQALLENLGSAGAMHAREPGAAGVEVDEVRALVAETGAGEVLEFSLRGDAAADAEARAIAFRYGVSRAQACGPTLSPSQGAAAPRFDGVVCAGLLEVLPDEDVPWVIEGLFARAGRFVYAAVDDAPNERVLPNGSTQEIRSRGRSRWLASFEAASARHPNVRWRLALWTCGPRGRRKLRVREGGRALGGTPRVWVINDGSTEHAEQALGLAESLGWPFQVKRAKSSALARLGRRHWIPGLGLDPDTSRGETSWPDLVIASGRSGSRAARWVGRRSHGRTRVVELGTGRERSAEPFDIVIASGCSDVPPDLRRIETTGPLAGAIGRRPTGGAAPRLHGMSHPRVALLVGRRERSAAAIRRMADEVARSAQAAGGAAFAVSSPRTRLRIVRALARGLGGDLAVRRSKPSKSELCDPDHLAAADALVVPGTNEALLVQAVATDKPVYIYRLPRQRVGIRQRFARWVHGRARARPLNRRGTVRPQQGLEYLCARLVERGFVCPPRDPEVLCQALIRRGLAKPFGATLDATERTPFREAEQVAARLRSLLGSPAAPGAHATH